MKLLFNLIDRFPTLHPMKLFFEMRENGEMVLGVAISVGRYQVQREERVKHTTSSLEYYPGHREEGHGF